MTTWTLRQIDQAEGIRAKMYLSSEVVARSYVDVRAVTRKQMFQRMNEIAHSFAIELHPGDLRFRQRDAEHMQVEVTAWWEPRTREVELRGGERDGEVLEFSGAPQSPILLAQSVGDLARLEPGDEIVPTMRPIVYSLSGWLEDERRWVYEAG